MLHQTLSANNDESVNEATLDTKEQVEPRASALREWLEDIESEIQMREKERGQQRLDEGSVG